VTEHTKLPWKVQESLHVVSGESMRNGRLIANTGGFSSNMEESSHEINKANAEYIVHSANLYPKMLEMLEDIEFDSGGYCTCCGMLDGHWENCELSALLREARGQAK
jgi:hypothetical protein